MALLGNEAGPNGQGVHVGYSLELFSVFSLPLTLAEWIWLLYSQLSIVSAYCARCFTLFWLTRRANCSILRVGLHWPQRGKQAAIRVACGMWHAEHVEHWTEATLMISVRQCKTDKTHFQIVHLCYVTSARKYPRQIWGEMERAISSSRRDYNWGMIEKKRILFQPQKHFPHLFQFVVNFYQLWMCVQLHRS